MTLAAPMLFAIGLAVGDASCAHQPALVVTGDSLHAAALTFEATAAGLASANEQGLLKPEQRAAWNAFLPRFKASFHLACDLWRSARDADDKVIEEQASAVIGTLLAELAPFTAILLAHPPAPDAGVARAAGALVSSPPAARCFDNLCGMESYCSCHGTFTPDYQGQSRCYADSKQCEIDLACCSKTTCKGSPRRGDGCTEVVIAAVRSGGAL